MPVRGDIIFYEKKEVKVMEVLVLDQKIKILLPDGKMMVVDLEEITIKK
jgi:hypothetical protein